MNQIHPDAKHILFPATSIAAVEKSGPRTMQSAEGVWVTDDNGKKVLDGIAGLWCVNVGHGRKELAEIAANSIKKLDFFHTFNGHSNEAQNTLAKRIAEKAPGTIDHAFFGCTGSDANDTLIKLSWLYHATRGNPKKTKIIARERAYHGTSISSVSLTGLDAFHRNYPLPEPWVVRISCPHYWRFKKEGETEKDFSQRLTDELEETIKREDPSTIAAYIGEPIIGAGGVIPPPEGYWEKVQKICKTYDILFIADEVVSGFGRTGTWFASEHYEIDPDMVTVAKGITSGVFPLSGALLSKEVHDVLRQSSLEVGSLLHGYTYSGHPVGAAIANGVLDIIEKENLVQKAGEQGAYLLQQLRESLQPIPGIGEIRGKGLLAGIQIVDKDNPDQIEDPSQKTALAITTKAYEKGVIARPLYSSSSIALSPPFTISKKEIDILVDTLRQAALETAGTKK